MGAIRPVTLIFELPQQAIVIVALSSKGPNEHGSTKVLAASALSPRRPATHNRGKQSSRPRQLRRGFREAVEGTMSEKIYDVSADWAKRAWVDGAKYQEMYARSVADPNGFWAEHGKRIGWMKPFSKVENVSFAPGNISIKWFEDGVLNVAWNCIDRHLAKRGDQTAIIWEGDNPSESKHIT